MGRRANWPPRVTIHKASGTERVRFKGVDYPLGPAGSEQARRAYAELLARLVAEGEGPTGPAPPLTVGQACQLWRVEALARYGPGNQELLEHDWAWAPVLARFADLPVGQFTAARLREARDGMVASGLSRNVVNRRVGRVRTAWRWLDEQGHAPAGSWAALRALAPLAAHDRRARSTPPVQAAAWPDVAAVCRRLAPSPRALLLCQWWTGARPSELFRLTVGQLTGPAPLAVPIARHKTAHLGHARRLVFGPRALRAVAGLLAGRHPDALAFPNARGEAFDRRSYYLAVRRACARAGVRLHPYQLRHSAATRLAAELGAETARTVLGHASLSSTQIYAERDHRLADEAAKKCG